ncbi:SAM-dependent methyltransferase [Dongia deserti]|uniref:SAM-dependent methyltransferase n=1 Tax=Dongia deserti TaxID=2268030 RepID=UPI000E645DAB|nr:class I SAM-dependent methyltransferase [Dongia deserti]
MSTERQVAKHYTHGSLQQAIFDALRAMGKDPERFSAMDLSTGDELHLGWVPATAALAKDLGLAPGMHVLDVGSGIGGPARFFAETHRCRVTGIDLTDEFVQVATELTRRCGLSDLVSFRQGSALDLPFSAGAFDAATLIHVGMNIADKARLFESVRRVLKPGALFGVYEIMHAGKGDLPYPMPWAQTRETSFVETPETYRHLLSAAGFTIESEENRREFVLDLARQMREKAEKHGMPPLNQQVLMGPAFRERLGNVMATLERGTIAPVQIIARAA